MASRFSFDCVHLLDEAQGLTLEMAEAWLRAHGWTQDGAGLKGWSKPKTWVYGDSVKSLLGEIPEIARIEGMSVQQVLREMNPRMRKGPPSKAARDAARPCYWLASWTAIGRIGANLWDSDMMDHFADSPEIVEWSFWVCDAAANKIRWPVDEKGVML